MFMLNFYIDKQMSLGLLVPNCEIFLHNPFAIRDMLFRFFFEYYNLVQNMALER